MKKICILLALVLALGCAPAFAAEGDAILGRSSENTLSFNYCFAQGDTLFLVSYVSLYAYHVGDSDLQEYNIAVPEGVLDGIYSFEYNALPFASDGKLYALNLITEYGEYSEFKGAILTGLTLGSDGDALSEYICDVDWSDMVEFYDNNSYAIQPDIIIGAQGKAFARYYDNQGDYRTVSIDLATGATEPVEALTGALTIVPYADGKLLAELYNGEIDQTAKLACYDPADGSLTQLCDVPAENYNPPLGLAYDAASDTLYCARAGEICPIDLATGEIGEGVTEMPLEAYSAAPGCILDGGYYAFCGEGAAVRNLDPGQKAQTKLRINDSFWSDSVNAAYYRFANAHGDISVVLSREYSEVENLIENMMNRDDRVDLYVLTTSNSVYEALYNRGYLMELDGNEKVKALADGMYPSLREKLSTDGRLVALPLSTYSWSVGINEKALEKLGMTLADVPNNWSDFLDFLAGLTDVMTEESGIRLVSGGYTDSDVRYELMNMILSDYQYYVNGTDPDMGYDNPLVHELLEKLEKIDFVALGCPADMDADQMIMLDGYDEDSVLMSSSTGCSIGNFYSQFTPVLMHVTEDSPAYLVLDTTVLVINPFTKNAEAALAFAGEVADNLTTQTRYCVNPDLNEPIRGEQNQAVLQELEEELKSMKGEYENVEADEKQSFEEMLREAEKTYEMAEENNWDVSPLELNWYRANDDDIIVSVYNWLYPDTTSEEDGGVGQTAEAEELMDQYLEGRISLNDMLAGIDNKVRMRRLEGN